MRRRRPTHDNAAAATPATRLAGTVLLLAALVVPAARAAGEYAENPDAQALIAELVAEDGLDAGALTALIAGAAQRKPILEAIARPAEKSASWAEYRPRFVEEKRIALGLAFWDANAPALARAARTYGVPPEYVVAIIGVETRYGRNKGSWRIVDALATLAFDYPPRAPFFREQLKQFIRLQESAGIDIANATGSYAGAMGYPQFMPTSYRDFAVDFDADGRVDLIDNPVDAIGSVANYFRAHGWTPGASVAARAAVSGAGNSEVVTAVVNQGVDPKFTVAQLREAGVVAVSCFAGELVPQQDCADPLPQEPATAWQLDGEAGAEYWVGLGNFQVITRYNRSAKYALAVMQLAHALRDTRRERLMAGNSG